MTDSEFMRIAIEESRRGDWPYGAVLVKDGAIVFKGCNTATRDRDPTAHADRDPPLWLVTAADAGRRGGFVATTVIDASIVDAMPRQLITVNKRHYTYPIIEASGALAMHLIDETQLDLVWRFGLQSGRD